MGKVRDEVVNSLLRLDYTTFTYPSEPRRAFVRGSILRNVRYHMIIGLAILANSISIGLTVDRPSDALFAALATEGGFCFIFSVDLTLRLFGLGVRPYITSHWHKFDVLLLLLQYMQILYVAINGNSGSVVRVLSSLRMLRIFRLLRTMSLLPRFRGLWILMSAMGNALRALMWVGAMILLLMYALGITFTLLIHQTNTEMYTNQYWKKDQYWGSIPRSMFTLYQITTLDDWSNHIIRPFIYASEIQLWLRLVVLGLTLLVIWFISFGFLQVTVGVMCESAGIWGKENEIKLKIFQAEEDLKIFRILRKIFAATEMTEEALKETLRRRSVRRLLGIVDLTHKDVSKFFTFFVKERISVIGTVATLGGNNAQAHTTEVLTPDEFATKIPYLRGNALGREFIAVEVKVKNEVDRAKGFLASSEQVNENLQTIQDDLNRIYNLVRSAATRQQQSATNSPVASNSAPK